MGLCWTELVVTLEFCFVVGDLSVGQLWFLGFDFDLSVLVFNLVVLMVRCYMMVRGSLRVRYDELVLRSSRIGFVFSVLQDT